MRPAPPLATVCPPLRPAHFPSVFPSLQLFMYGMLCVILSTGVWLLVASFFELPVSTTHSTVGGVVGFGIVAGGFDAVVWSASSTEFPYFSGVSAIVASWAISPVLSALVAAAFFLAARSLVLRRPRPYQRSLQAFPVLVGITAYINTIFILWKGARSLDTVKRLSQAEAAWISAIVAAVATAAACLVTFLYLDGHIARRYDLRLALRAERERLRREKEAAVIEEGRAGGDGPAAGLQDCLPTLTRDLSGTGSGGTCPGGTDAPASTPDQCAAHGRTACGECEPPLPPAAGETLDAADAALQGCWAHTASGGRSLLKAISAPFKHGMSQDIHDCVDEDARIHEMHGAAEVVHPPTRRTAARPAGPAAGPGKRPGEVLRPTAGGPARLPPCRCSTRRLR